MEASSSPTTGRRPSLLSTTTTLRNSFRKMKGPRINVKESNMEPSNKIEPPVLKDPSFMRLDSDGSYPSSTSSPIAPKDLIYSPIIAEQRGSGAGIGVEGSAIKELLGRMRSDSQKKRDSGSSMNGSGHGKARSRSASRMSRLRQVVQVDEAEKVNLLTRLRATLHSIEQSLHLTEKELETHLEEHDFVLDKAASDFLERTGLRQIEPNRTLKKIEMKDDNPSISNAWSHCDPSVFNVRCGPQYRKTKLKAPASPQTLYDMVAVDVYSSQEKMEHISRFMKIGDLEQGSDHPLPSVFIVNFMLPLTEPKFFASDPNGPTVAFQFIMKLSKWAKQNPEHASVQLAAKFMNESGSNGSMRERLKIIVQVANPSELDLGKVERGLCRQYNGLPFLYRTYNSQYHRGFGWFQADFDGHKSGYATRLARHSLLGWSEDIVANVAFLVEAETDEEMPERILGCANVHRLHCRNAEPFIKPVATPLSPRIIRSRDPANSVLSDNEDAESSRRQHKDSLLSEPDENFGDAISDPAT